MFEGRLVFSLLFAEKGESLSNLAEHSDEMIQNVAGISSYDSKSQQTVHSIVFIPFESAPGVSG
jgi:hypothetical protein